jgi:hypothetical protein
MMHKVVSVAPLGEYRIAIEFDDGVSATVDLADLAGEGVFAAWRDPEFFRAVRIGDSGELVWGDQIDLCPDSLYLRATGKRPEDIFPALKQGRVHA